MSTKNSNWWVYFVRCSDNSIYCGITRNIERRIKEHNQGNKGAKYTRSRRPVKLIWKLPASSRSEASKIEIRLKRLCKADKENIVDSSTCHDYIAGLLLDEQR